MGSMAMTPEEIEQKMDELARKYVETHNDPSKGWGRKKSHKTPLESGAGETGQTIKILKLIFVKST
jgi:hypothetical protein